MKASTRNWGIALTFLFIGLAGYAGYELYQLPISITDNINKEKDARIREIRMLILDNRDRRGKNLNDRELLKSIREELVKEVEGKESEKRKKAQELATPSYRAFALTLLVGIVLMFLLLASSYQTSAETIVYIEREEDEESDQQEEMFDQDGKLSELVRQIKNGQIELETSKDGLESLLSLIALRLNVGAAAIYKVKQGEEFRKIELIAGYAFIVSDRETLTYDFGEGLAGQVAKTGAGKLFNSVPSGYVEIFSGLGESSPNYLAILPIIRNKEVMGVMEVALLEKLSDQDYQNLKEINHLVGEQSDWETS